MTTPITTYAVFLRGIGPTKPNMRNAKICAVLEEIGLRNVRSVITSGNFIFESSSKNTAALEKKIEKALKEKLDIPEGAFVRTRDELENMLGRDPFKGKTHGGEYYLIVTFLKPAPYQVYTATNHEAMRTPEVMTDLEKKYGGMITSRTWKTIGRVVEKMKHA